MQNFQLPVKYLFGNSLTDVVIGMLMSSNNAYSAIDSHNLLVDMYRVLQRHCNEDAELTNLCFL